MSTLTLTRTPRYIRTTALASATKFQLELYIFTGVIGDKPATATYTLEKDIINGATQVTFEINELVRDYYEQAVGTTSSAGAVLWVIADVTGFTATSVGSTVSTTLHTTYFSKFKHNTSIKHRVCTDTSKCRNSRDSKL